MATSLKMTMKIAKKTRKPHTPTIVSLPNELVTEILARLASHSFTDLSNAKKSCKDFLGAATDNYIFQQVSLDKFHGIPWDLSTKASHFLERCKECGNAESLYRQGMVDYFSSMKIESGLEYLKRAAEKGHIEASYVNGIILICSQGQLMEQGLKLLSSLKNTAVRGSRIRECRKRIKGFMQVMWINNYIVKNEELYCHTKTCNSNKKAQDSMVVKRKGWLSSSDYQLDEENDDTFCEACRCDHEVTLFCNMLRGKV